MEFKTCWEELGISPTTDKEIIRRAFADKSSQCHPEEHPEAFKQLHDAYKTALNASRNTSAFIPPAPNPAITREEPLHQAETLDGSERKNTKIPNMEKLIQQGLKRTLLNR